MSKIYFKGLSELRGLACLLVIFHHIELYKEREGLSSLFKTNLDYFIGSVGSDSVRVFFILSGFLISYLLLKEKEKKGRINIKNFYFRSILRIWPLYYLVVLISFFLVPYFVDFFDNAGNETFYFSLILKMKHFSFFHLLLFLLFLPNLALKLFPPVVGASQSWSIGVEEQFYLVWPHLFNKTSNKFQLLLLFVIIFFPFLEPLVYKVNFELGEWFNYLIKLFPIHTMGSGGLAAIVLFYYRDWLDKYFFKPAFFLINTIVFIFMFFYHVHYIIFGVITSIQILFFIQKDFKFNLRNSFLSKIGQISYGMYMYHPLVMFCCFIFVNSYIDTENTIFYNTVLYSSIILITFLVSQFSFVFFESKFLKLKEKRFSNH